MNNTLNLKYDGIEIRTVSKGWGFILQAVVIVAKNKEEKQARMAEFLKVKNSIRQDIKKLDWKTVYDKEPKVYILTESYFKKKKHF